MFSAFASFDLELDTLSNDQLIMFVQLFLSRNAFFLKAELVVVCALIDVVMLRMQIKQVLH